MSSAFWCVERLSYLLPLRHCNPIRDLRHLTSDLAGAHVTLRSVAATKRIYRDLCVRTAQQWAVAGHFQLFGRCSRQCDVQMIAQWMNYHSTEHKSCTESVGEHDCGCIGRHRSCLWHTALCQLKHTFGCAELPVRVPDVP